MSSVVTRGRRHTVVDVNGSHKHSKVLLVTVIEATGLACGACLVYFKAPQSRSRRLEVTESELQFATSTIDPRKNDAVWNECFDLPWSDEWHGKALRLHVMRNHMLRKGCEVFSGCVDLEGLESPKEEWVEMSSSTEGDSAKLLVRLHLVEVESEVFNGLSKRLNLLGTPRPRKAAEGIPNPDDIEAGDFVLEENELGAGDVTNIKRTDDIGRLNVEISCGYDLCPRAARDAGDVTDETKYVCKFFWRDRKFVTGVSESTDCPEWAEFFSFPVDESEAKHEFLVVSVFTHRGALVGSACIPVETVGISTKSGDWYLFQHGRCGQVYIQCVLQVESDALRSSLIKRQHSRQKLSLMQRAEGISDIQGIADVNVTARSTPPVSKEERKEIEAQYIQFSGAKTLADRLVLADATNVKLTVACARDLPTRDVSSGSVFPESRVCFKWCGADKETPTVKGVNPKWGDTFDLVPKQSALQSSTVLDLSVVDKRQEEDVVIGVAKLDLINLDRGHRAIDHWVHLDTRGAVRVRVELPEVKADVITESTPLATTTETTPTAASPAAPLPSRIAMAAGLSHIPKPREIPKTQTCVSMQVITAINVKHKCVALTHAPYVKASWNGLTFRTHVTKNHKQPIWQEVFDLRWDLYAATVQRDEHKMKVQEHNQKYLSAEARDRAAKDTAFKESDGPDKYISLHLFCHSKLHDTYMGTAHVSETYLDALDGCSGTLFLPLFPHKNPKMALGSLEPLATFTEVKDKPVLALRFTKFVAGGGVDHKRTSAKRIRRRSTRLTSTIPFEKPPSKEPLC